MLKRHCIQWSLIIFKVHYLNVQYCLFKDMSNNMVDNGSSLIIDNVPNFIST